MIAAWMVYATAVGALIAAAAAALEVMLRGRGPTRWIWACAMAASLGIPSVGLLSVSRPDVEAVGNLLGVDDGVVAGLSDELPYPEDGGPGAARSRSRSALDVRLPGLPVSWGRLPALPDGWGRRVGSVWGLLSGLGILWIVWATVALRLRRRGWRRSSVNGREILISEDTGPAVVGLWNSEIVLPRWSLALEAVDRELMLRHEEEHRRAHDLLLVTAAVALLVVLPWNPALWWQLQRLRLAVEIDCDRRVLSGRTDVGRYGSLLLDLGDRCHRRRVGVALAFARPMPFLERRIRVMTGTGALRPLRATLLAALATVLALGACRIERPPMSATPSGEPIEASIEPEDPEAPGPQEVPVLVQETVERQEAPDLTEAVEPQEVPDLADAAAEIQAEVRRQQIVLQALLQRLDRQRQMAADSVRVRFFRRYQQQGDSMAVVADSARVRYLRLYERQADSMAVAADSMRVRYLRQRSLRPDSGEMALVRRLALAEARSGAGRRDEEVDRPRTFVFFSPQGIAGRVLAPDSVTPLEGVAVWVPGFEVGTETGSGPSGETGRFLLPGVPRGARRLVFEHPEVGRWETEVEVRPDEMTDLGDVIAPGG
jgi:hypothetical protein